MCSDLPLRLRLGAVEPDAQHTLQPRCAHLHVSLGRAKLQLGSHGRMGNLPGPDAMDALARRLRRFTQEREWGQFHSPKNLASALIVEAAELLVHFQWLTEEQSRNLNPENLSAVRDEIGDILIYLIRLADELGIDPLEAANHKLEKNAEKYPADKVRGKALKYNEYPE